MDFSINLNTLIEGLILALIVWGLKKLATMSELSVKHTQWIEDHQRQCEERHELSGRQFSAIWEQLNKLTPNRRKRG